MKKWKLTWEDNFETEKSFENWIHDIGNHLPGGHPGWGNGELQYYTEQGVNTKIENEKLVISLVKENFTGISNNEEGQFTFTSAKLNSKRTFKFGKLEFRVKIDGGKGVWPALWLLPKDKSINGRWPMSGEIDVMEAKGSNIKSTSSALHFSNKDDKHDYTFNENQFEGTTFEEFHVYSVIWEEDNISFLIDGKVHLDLPMSSFIKNDNKGNAFKNGAPFDQEFYIIMNLAVGGHFDGNPAPDADYFPRNFTIDYIKYYEVDNE